MPKPTSIKAVLLRPSADGRHTVYIRIAKGGKKRHIATEVAVLEKYFNKLASIDNPNWIKKSHPLATEYNKILFNLLIELSPFRSEKQLSAQQIKEKIVAPPHKDTINDYWATLVDGFKKAGKHSLYEKHRAERNKFCAWRAEVFFHEIKYEFVKQYHAHLLSINKPSTATKSLEFLQQVIKEAIRDEKMAKNPFELFEIKRTQTTSHAKQAVPSVGEFKAFASKKIPEGTPQAMARDLFLTQVYCSGARVGEILALKNKDIEGDWVSYAMEKKGEGKVRMKKVYITPALRKIINYYQKPGAVYLFPYMEGVDEKNMAVFKGAIKNATTQLNNNLRRTCKNLGIMAMTTHTARHIVGQLLENMGIDIKDIKNSIGHENESQTTIYMKNNKPIQVEETAILLYNELKT